MAKPIMDIPVLRGKAAKKFEDIFLKNARPDPKKAEQNRKDIELYRNSKVVR